MRVKRLSQFVVDSGPQQPQLDQVAAQLALLILQGGFRRRQQLGYFLQLRVELLFGDVELFAGLLELFAGVWRRCFCLSEFGCLDGTAPLLDQDIGHLALYRRGQLALRVVARKAANYSAGLLAGPSRASASVPAGGVTSSSTTPCW